MTCWQPWSKPGDPDREPLESWEHDDFDPTCPVCGEYGPCGFTEAGEPMICKVPGV